MWVSTNIAENLKGKLYGCGQVPFTGCALDSRKVGHGEIFVAIRGEKTDGHRYIADAFQAGAGMVIAEQAVLEEIGMPQIPADKAIIAVQDSVIALQALAKAWREKLDPIVVAITGSSGKTTTKDMIASVLAEKYKIHKNMENFNNEIGLPLTILNAPFGTEVLVLEMGMRGLGQIAMLCEICKPGIGVITNIGTTHMELLGTQENIAEAKWELIQCLPKDGVAVLNAEDDLSVSKANKAAVKQIFYGIEGKYHPADIQAIELASEGTMGTAFTAVMPQQKAAIHIPLPGEHHVLDALAALAVGYILQVPTEKSSLALAEMKSSKMRLEVQQGVFDSVIINDVYNANPDSMKASLRVLAERGGTKTIAVLGEMYELGDLTVSGHREVGEKVARLGIQQLVTVGEMAVDIASAALEAGMPPHCIHVCEDCDQAAEVTRKQMKTLGSATWVLVKGSRGMMMERVSEQLYPIKINEA